MIKEIIIFFVLEFLLAIAVSFILRGSLNVKKMWVYFDEAIGFAFIIGLFVLLWNFGSFEFVNVLIEFAWASLLFAIVLVVFTMVIGIEIGNWLEKLIRGPRKRR